MSFLSVDVGSSSCKGAIFSARGELLGVRSAAYISRLSNAGFAEMEAQAFHRIVTNMVRELTSIPEIEPIEAICFSAHGETIIPVSDDGHALGPAILNFDGRAVAEAAWLEKEFGRKQLFELTGHTAQAIYPLPKILWLRKNAPQLFNSASRFLGVTDYLLVQFGLPPMVDYSHASRFMCFDVRHFAWAKQVLELAQISEDRLPIPVQAGTIAGLLTADAAHQLGVSVGTPVVVGGHDQEIGAIGMGVIGPGRAAASLGTYECVLFSSDQPHLDDSALSSNLNSYPHAAPGQYASIAYFPSGIMVQWLANLLSENSYSDHEQLLESLEAAAPEAPTGLLITPHLIGSCNPDFNPQLRGTISGLGFDSNRSQVYKGILEGIAAELDLITDCLEDAGCRFSDLNVSGGGARSALGLRLRAAFTEKRLHVMRCQESVCLGGAMLASVALGVHADLEAAARVMVSESKTILPDPALTEQYKLQAKKYRQRRSSLIQHNHQSLQIEGEPA